MRLKHAACVVFVVALSGCTLEPWWPAPANEFPVGMTHTTLAEVPHTEPWLTPSLRISGDIVRRCVIHQDDVVPYGGYVHASALEPQDQDMLLQIAKCFTTGPLAGRSIRLVSSPNPRSDTASAEAPPTTHQADMVRRYLLESGVAQAQVKEATRQEADVTEPVDVWLD